MCKLRQGWEGAAGRSPLGTTYQWDQIEINLIMVMKNEEEG